MSGWHQKEKGWQPPIYLPEIVVPGTDKVLLPREKLNPGKKSYAEYILEAGEHGAIGKRDLQYYQSTRQKKGRNEELV